MTDTDSERPQDVGRRHRRKGSPDPVSAALLDRYLGAMRDELGALLDSLQPVPQDQGLGMVEVPPKLPTLSERSKIWDLAIKLGRELGSAIDPTPTEVANGAPTPPRVSPRRIDYGKD